ncbi:hypothetical protein EYC84_004682 [Monilinia fructicola]|uniref:Uncharacterized protein n=1 Tax=Monilinia fructicola TaxID=38448 RepID=A0A5M9K513_MONFR|nr:hypothetical protein EYC84_004682 [Monilinia fructicola]
MVTHFSINWTFIMSFIIDCSVKVVTTIREITSRIFLKSVAIYEKLSSSTILQRLISSIRNMLFLSAFLRTWPARRSEMSAWFLMLRSKREQNLHAIRLIS